jgi:hypothetical protein
MHGAVAKNGNFRALSRQVLPSQRERAGETAERRQHQCMRIADKARAPQPVAGAVAEKHGGMPVARKREARSTGWRRLVARGERA